MTITLAFLALAGGFTLLVIGGEALVRAAISLAIRTNISPAIISLTIVAAGTSAPELVTSVSAALKGTPDIAAGNVFGSNIFNVLAILGLSFLIYPPKSTSHVLGFEWLVIFLSTATIYFLAQDLFLNQWEGIGLLIALGITLWVSVQRARRIGFEQEEGEELEPLKNPALDAVYLLIGLTALVGGAQLALEGGVFIGRWVGLSDKIIGITIISVGTGLPELATSTVAAFRGRSDVAIGNVLGSNLINTLAVFGATATITPLSISEELLKIDFWFFLMTTLLLLPVVRHYRYSLTRFAGIMYLLLYIGYIWGGLTDWSL